MTELCFGHYIQTELLKEFKKKYKYRCYGIDGLNIEINKDTCLYINNVYKNIVISEKNNTALIMIIDPLQESYPKDVPKDTPYYTEIKEVCDYIKELVKPNSIKFIEGNI